jgi:hypothetical protein
MPAIACAPLASKMPAVLTAAGLHIAHAAKTAQSLPKLKQTLKTVMKHAGSHQHTI